MTRSVPEWIGATPDTKPPPRVRVRVFGRTNGRCHKCTRKIPTGDKWTLEHVKALVNGGENRESNLDVTCDWCLPEKNAADVAEKARTYRKRAKHIGVSTKRKQLIPGSKGTRFKQKVNRTTVLRSE